MRKAVLILGLILSIGFQGFALASQVLGWDRCGDTAHSVMHAEHVAHHHEHDGTVHKDASKKSLQHVQDHCCVQCACVLPSGIPPLAASPDDRSGIEAVCAGHDSAFLEGLKRPPRAA